MTKNKKRLLIVLAIILTAGLTTLGVVSRGFRNWNYKEWFKGAAAKAVTVEEQPIEQRAMALTSADDNDIDHTIIHDSDEATTTATVVKATAPRFEMLGYGVASDVAKTGTRLKIIAEESYAVFYYTSGEIYVRAFNPTGSGEYGNWTFQVTPEQYAFYIESDELAACFDKAGYRDIRFSAYISGVEGCTNSDTVYYGLYDLRGHTVDFDYLGALVNISVDEDFFAGNNYSVSVGSYQGTDSLLDLKNATNNKGNAITKTENGFVVDLSKVAFYDEISASGATPFIRVAVDITAARFSINGMYGPCAWVDSYFEISKLSTPTNLTYNSGVITWNEVNGANRYGVFWTDKQGVEQHVVTSETAYTFDLNTLGAGEHTIRVRALGNIGEHIVDSEIGTMQLTAYNASNTVTQLVALTLSVNGDSIVKLVPYGKNVSDYCYEVDMPNKEFLGWYYDNGFSRKVETTDVLTSDTTIYARLADKKVTERPLSWWEQNMWYVLGPIIALAVVGIVVGVVLTVRKKKAA